MTDNAGYELGYGHFGPAIYDAERKRWRFGRIPGTHMTQGVAGNLHKLVHNSTAPEMSPVDNDSTDTDNTHLPALRRLQHSFKTLVKEYPETQLSKPFFTPLAKESESMLKAVSRYDPLKGDLLAYGRITNSVGQDVGPVEVVAIPSGINGGALKLVRIDKHVHYGWDDGRMQLEVPSPGEEAGLWVGPGVPIQQICFSNSSVAVTRNNQSRGTLLAVRLVAETWIFRPVLRTSTVTQLAFAGGSNFSLSQIDPNPFVALTEDMTEGVKHADVTFNPWYVDQLAIVDPNGNTAVFEISPNSSKATHSTKEFRITNMQICHFPSTHEPDVGRSQNHPQNDWARVMWLTNPKTLLICTRTRLAIIDLKRQSTHEPSWQIPKLGLNEMSNLILDVRRHPRHLNQVFVLTSTHVFWLYIECEDKNHSENGLQCGANLMASIRHFRGQADVTLQLSLTLDGNEIVLTIFSRLNLVVTTYRLTDSSEFYSLRVIVSDPATVVLTSPIFKHDQSLSFLQNIALHPVNYVHRPGAWSYPGFSASLKEYGIRFDQLHILGTDLGLYRLFLWKYDGPPLLQNSQKLEISEPRKFMRPEAKSTVVVYDDLDDFIVPDLQKDHMPRTISLTHETRSVHYSNKSKAGSTQASSNLSPLYRHLQRPIATSESHGHNNELIDVISIMESMRETLLERLDNAGEPMRGLIELVPPYTMVSDIDTASNMFGELLRIRVPGESPDDSSLVVKRITAKSMVKERPSDTILSSIYRSIIRTMLSPLPTTMSARFRLAFEENARVLAADVCLSSTRVELENPQSEGEEIREIQEPFQSSQPATQHSFILPFHSISRELQPALSRFSASNSSSGFDPLPHAVATELPSPLLTPSINSSTLSSSTIQASYTNLRRYVTFAKSLPLARSETARPLAHWTIGVDPTSYSWTATQRIIEDLEDAAIEESGLTQRERDHLRRKAERKAEKYLRKQREEARKRANRIEMSSSQPMVVASTSLGETVLPSSSQQQFLSSQLGVTQQQASSQMPTVVASQIEPGRHGGRVGPPPRKKKKAGF